MKGTGILGKKSAPEIKLGAVSRFGKKQAGAKGWGIRLQGQGW